MKGQAVRTKMHSAKVFKGLHEKAGSIFVEAAIVYPIVFLCIMVIIRLILILFNETLDSASDHMNYMAEPTRYINEVIYVRCRYLIKEVL